MTNTLYTGDNLHFLNRLNSESVDLIYLDPPFNSKRTYSAPIGSKAAGASFKDMWTWEDVDEQLLETLITKHPCLVDFIKSVQGVHGKPMMAYCVYMAQRIIEMQRILKPTGSIYLHCDPTASHYFKVILDKVFGKDNFRNEIIWKRTSAHNDPRQFGRIVDSILFYSNGDDYTFNKIYTPHDQDYINANFRHKDKRGLYKVQDLTGPKVNNNDEEWQGWHPKNSGRSWSCPKRVIEKITGKKDNSDLTTNQKLDLMLENDYIHFSKNGIPGFKSYLDDLEGSLCQSIWTDIGPIQSQAKERTGYPTQKPLALLHRIIEASSNEGDMVLDPFCGCATTCVASQQLGRKWIGIDIEEQAASLLVERLSDDAGLFKDFVHTFKLPERTDIAIEAPTSTSLWESLYDEQGGKCNGCGLEVERNLEIDHIIPKSKGGSDTRENYQLLCGNCNRIKGNRPMEYLRQKIALRDKLLSQQITFGK